MLFDQQWHARRRQELGVGVYVPRGRGFASRLGRALDAVIDGDRFRAAAAAIRARLDADDGSGNAADRIEAALDERLGYGSM